MLILPGVQVSPSLPGFIVYPVLPIIKSAMARGSRATSGTWGKMSLEGHGTGAGRTSWSRSAYTRRLGCHRRPPVAGSSSGTGRWVHPKDRAGTTDRARALSGYPFCRQDVVRCRVSTLVVERDRYFCLPIGVEPARRTTGGVSGKPKCPPSSREGERSRTRPSANAAWPIMSKRLDIDRDEPEPPFDNRLRCPIHSDYEHFAQGPDRTSRRWGLEDCPQ